MSLDATRWAWMQQIKPASLKLVLLSLADRASGDDFICYPSIQTICEDTGLDRKTVISSIEKLCLICAIKKVSRPNKNNIYKLIGVPSRNNDETFHIVYKTTDPLTNEYYLGVHTTSNKNDGYKGSGRWVTTHQDVKRLKVEIISNHSSRREACQVEIELIEKHINDPLCKNCFSEKGNLSISIKNDEFFGSTENGTYGSPKNGTMVVPKTGLTVVPKTVHEPINITNQLTDINKSESLKKLPRLGIPYQEIVNLYHERLPELAQVYKLTAQRKTRIKNIWLDELDSIEYWGNYFSHISKSKFLMGKSPPGINGRIFIADFDFLINPTNYVKIAEDKYHEPRKIQRR